MDRAPGLSVRLKLTLSYAGFLMVAGALMLAAAWLAGQQRQPFDAPAIVPNGVISSIGAWCPGTIPSSCASFAPAAAVVLAFLLVFGLLGGWLLAGRMLAPLTRITDATRMAATGSLSHRIELPGRNDEFRELADAFDAMLARLEAHVAEQQRFAANASHELRTPLAITQTLLDVARNDPNRDTGELVDRLHAVNTRAIDLTEALLLLSRADQRAFTEEHVDLSLIAEEAAETLLPLAEKRGLSIETAGETTPTIGSHALLLQMSTNLVHNAIVHNLPEHGTVWVTTGVHPKGAVLTVENTGENLTPELVATLSEPFRRGSRTHTHRPRRCRPRPGNRREHHPGPRRNPHPHPPGRGRALRHGAATRRATARRQMTIVVVSTHLDDAVLSCWSIVAGDADVAVVTVFTGAPDDPNLVTDWDRDTGLTSNERMAARIEENRAALAIAGRVPTDLGFLESQYGARSFDTGVMAECLRDAELVYLPAGIGVPGGRVHGDHVFVRDACLEIRPDARLYADQPYCLFRPGLELPEGLRDRYSDADDILLTPPQRERKAEAIAAYHGEVPKLDDAYRDPSHGSGHPRPGDVLASRGVISRAATPSRLAGSGSGRRRIRTALSRPRRLARTGTSRATWRERSRACLLMWRISAWTSSGSPASSGSSWRVAHHLGVVLERVGDLLLLCGRDHRAVFGLGW